MRVTFIFLSVNVLFIKRMDIIQIILLLIGDCFIYNKYL